MTVLGLILVLSLTGAAILAHVGLPENSTSSEKFDVYFPIALIIVANVMIILMTFNTNYVLENGYLKYRSGFVYGKIKISRVREIIVGETMRVGIKPAMATKGLIIKYDKFEDIYISPDSNESFVDAILKIKNDIVITYNKKPLD